MLSLLYNPITSKIDPLLIKSITNRNAIRQRVNNDSIIAYAVRTKQRVLISLADDRFGKDHDVIYAFRSHPMCLRVCIIRDIAVRVCMCCLRKLTCTILQCNACHGHNGG